MSLINQCPERERLNDYLSGQLAQEEAVQFERHLDQCSPCGETLQHMYLAAADDTFSDLVGSVASACQAEHGVDPQNQDDEPILAQLIQRVQATGPIRLSESAAADADRAAEIVCRLVPSSNADALGELSHYQLLEVLGSGSTGVVFAARDMRLNRDVAIKVLRPSLGLAAQERFLREAQWAATIEHDHVITIYDVGQANGLAFITMQWLPGETLEDRLSRVSFLPETEVRQIARQICGALVVAHRQNIVHRDIKPANIWIDTQRNQVKLLDFGLARVADADPQLTASGFLAGTPSYMSPEQTRGLELDGRSDLFSLGGLLYRCMTGRLPFSSTGVLATLQAIQHELPIPPSQMNPTCSESLSALIMALLEKQPDQRPRSASEVLSALETNSMSAALVMSIPRRGKSESPSLPVKTRANGASWKVAAAIVWLVILGGAGYLFGPDVVRIATNHGEIVVETDDPAIQVQVLQHGNLVRVIDAATQRSVDIAAGEYTLRPLGDGGEFLVTPDSVVLTRGGQQIVRVTRADAADRGTAAEQPAAPTYDGHTFQEWLAILARERNITTVCSGIRAMAALSREDTRLRDSAISAVTPFMRLHGSWFYGGKNDQRSDVHDALNAFFSALPPRELVRIIEQELVHGNSESREHLIWLSIIGTIYEGDSKAQEEHRQALWNSSSQICETWLQTVQTLARQQETDEIRRLSRLASIAWFWQPVPVGAMGSPLPAVRQPSAVDPRLVERFVTEYRAAEFWPAKFAIAEFFVTFGIDQPLVYDEVSQLIENVEANAEDRYQAFRMLWKLPAAHADVVIPRLLAWVQNDDAISVYGRQLETSFFPPYARSMVTDYEHSAWLHKFRAWIGSPTLAVQDLGDPSNAYCIHVGGESAFRLDVPAPLGAQWTVVWLLSRYQNVPPEIAAKAIAWLQTMVQPVESADLSILRDPATRQLFSPAQMTKDLHDRLMRWVINHDVARAVRVLETGVVEHDPTARPQLPFSGGLF